MYFWPIWWRTQPYRTQYSFQTPLPVASEWTVLANRHGTLWHPCLPLGYRGLEQVFLLFLNNFSSFPFEMNLLKSTTRDNLKSTFSLLFFLFFFFLEKKKNQEVYSDEGPHFCRSCTPLPYPDCRASGWWRSPKGICRGWCLQPLSSALQPTTHSASEVCLPRVPWAVKACLRNKPERQWRRLYIKTWQNLNYSNIVIG